MAARLWTALLVLAAVVAMHGVQCATAADGVGRTATPDRHDGTSAVRADGPAASAADVVAVAVAMTAVGAGHPHAAVAAGIVLADPLLADPVPADPVLAVTVAGDGDSGSAAPAAAGTAGHAGTPHDAVSHLWTLCLAVLAAALAVLLALLVPRAVRLTTPALGRARSRLRSLAPPRPPDLSALCLLRI